MGPSVGRGEDTALRQPTSCPYHVAKPRRRVGLWSDVLRKNPDQGGSTGYSRFDDVSVAAVAKMVEDFHVDAVRDQLHGAIAKHEVHAGRVRAAEGVGLGVVVT